MNFIDIILTVFKGIGIQNMIILILMFILYIILKAFYPKLRGYMGEFWVKKELNKLPKDKYVVLNDIMLEDDNGTHQIDHIVLSNSKIFVIEMKNYYGYIAGNQFDNKWSQFLGKQRFFFNNPIHQNYGHIKCLAKLLNIEEENLASVICFSNSAKLKVKSNSIVTQTDLIKSEIECFNTDLLMYDKNSLANIILSNNISSKEKRVEHVKNIKNKIETVTNLENNLICPKCGNKLVERNGRYGKFTGCSNYPKCRYIKK